MKRHQATPATRLFERDTCMLGTILTESEHCARVAAVNRSNRAETQTHSGTLLILCVCDTVCNTLLLAESGGKRAFRIKMMQKLVKGLFLINANKKLLSNRLN